MKKVLVVLALIAGIGFSQQSGRALTKIEDTNNEQSPTSTTNYVGFATATTGSAIPNVSNAVWKIIKTTYDANGNELTYRHAFNTNVTASAGIDPVWSNTWTNRLLATYK